MKCNKCPLYLYWNGKGEECRIFGDSWDSPFLQYTDEGKITGCYIEKAYIDKVDKRIEEGYIAFVKYMLK